MDKANRSVINIEAIRRRFIGVLWLLTLLIAAANILTEGTIPLNREPIYLFEIATLVICLTLWPKASFSTTLILFVSLLALSNALNNPAPHFQSWERLAFFIMMLALLSPLIDNTILKILRQNLWSWLITIIKIEMIVEFILYIPWIIENYANNKGYIGLFGHHMLHALLAAIASTVFFWELVSRRCANRALGIALFFMSIVVLAASGSRCAILGFVAAVVPLLWSLRKNRNKFLTAGATAAFLIAAIIAIPNPLTKTLRYKFSLGEKHNSLTFSRNELWKARWSEFSENPWLGVGFCVNTHFSEHFDKPDKEGNYISEPGSAWLSLLANGGILSFGIFTWFNAGLFRRLFRQLHNGSSKSCSASGRPQPPHRSNRAGLPRALLRMFSSRRPQEPLLYLSLWLLLIVHGCFEGWILYAGSLVFVFYWLLTSQITYLPSCKKQAT